MKTALILTGHLRCFEQVYPNTFNMIIDRYNPDIFISTWNTEGYWTSPDIDKNNKGYNENSPKLDTKKVKELYKPKDIIVEKQIDFTIQSEKYIQFCQEIRPKNILSQFYKMYQGIQMMEKYSVINDIKYDLVIRMRPDLIFHRSLPNLNTDKFYTLYHRNHTGQGTGDMFFASDMTNMMMFKYFVHFYDELVLKCNNRFCPHMMIQEVLKDFEWEELNIPKMIMHSPNGEYQNYTKET